jgi:MurNAc alpha-1-phosphate uridylyltransferase
MLPIIVLAGGLATRLHPVTKDLPKSLIEVQGIPFIDWQLSLLSENGLYDVVLCVGYKSEQIQNHIGNGKKFGLNVIYSFDGEKPLGTAGAVKKALDKVDSKFAVLYGDSYLPINYKMVENEFLLSNADCLMTLMRNEDKYEKSNVEFENGKVLKYSKENPTSSMKHIDYGLTYYSKDVFKCVESDQYLDLASVIVNLTHSGDIRGHEVKQRFYEAGSFDGLIDFSRYLEQKKEQF